MTYKQDFIDENPYLTYSGKADNAYDGEGGGGGGYTLPTASADTLGGVKVGSGLSINEGGVLSENAFVITGDLAENSGNWTIANVSKTLNEIYSAINNGLIPIFIASRTVTGPSGINTTATYFHLDRIVKLNNVPSLISFSWSNHSMYNGQSNQLETWYIGGRIVDTQDNWAVEYFANTLQNQ